MKCQNEGTLLWGVTVGIEVYSPVDPARHGCRHRATCFHLMHGLPVRTAVCEVLPLLQLRLHQGAADTGVAVTIDSVAEPRARNADLGGVAPLHHTVVSATPFLHCFHDVRLSAPVLPLVSRRRQRGMKKAGYSGPPHP